MTNGSLKRALLAVIRQDQAAVADLARRLGIDVHTTSFMVISTAAQRWMDMIPDGVE
jgi:Mn-dependent DtxR family transcriptional regulator